MKRLFDDYEKIAKTLGVPSSGVATLWPRVRECLDSLGFGDENNYVAALATIAVEEPKFSPETEKYNGDPHEYFKRYDGRYGNDQPGDGYRYRGRGPNQLTFKDNYRRLGQELGVDLVGFPDKALDVDVSASIFAAFWRDHKVGDLARAENWNEVRHRINGGYNGAAKFTALAINLKIELAKEEV